MNRRNLHRRHLTASQRAMVASKARASYDKAAKERQKTAIKERDEKGRAKSTSGKVTGSGSSDSRDAAGKALGVFRQPPATTTTSTIRGRRA